MPVGEVRLEGRERVVEGNQPELHHPVKVGRGSQPSETPTVDAKAEEHYLLDLRDTTGLALDVLDALPPALEALERADAEMRRPRFAGDPAGPKAFNAKVAVRREVFIAVVGRTLAAGG